MKEEKKYIRDSRSPTPKNSLVSKVMSRNKAKATKPELLLRRALWAKGIRGYRINYKNVPGKPDIAFVSKKVCVFVHGCYWHRCPQCNYPLPKHNTTFWKEKFQKNKIRDRKKEAQLMLLGWTVITVWECNIYEDINKVVTIIQKSLLEFGSKNY